MPRFFRRFNTFVLQTGSTRSHSQSYTPKKKPTQKSWKPSKSVKVIKKDWSTPTTTARKFKRPEPQEITWLPKFGTKGFVYDRRGGDRSEFRKYKWYGEMKSLGPVLIFEVIPTRIFAQYYKARKKIEDYPTVMANTKASMQKVLDGLKIYAKFIINKYVPKETGDLRKAMMESINKSKLHGLSMKVVLDTGDIEYANPVNNMPQKKIRHTMGMGKIGRRSRVSLNDPKAVKGWFNFIDMLLNTKAKELLHNMIDDLVLAWVYRKAPTGFIHPPIGTRTIMVESQKDHETRMRAYDAIVGKSKAQIRALFPKGIPVIKRERKEIPLRNSDTIAKMRERKYKQEHIYIQKGGKFTKKQPLVIHYPRPLIKKFFKIRGLNKA